MTEETKAPQQTVIIFTDGACLGNPGPGGYGAVLLHGDERREFSGGRKLTTNNRMELLACIVALEELAEPSVVSITTDSRYVHDAIEKRWLASWQKKGWVNSEKKPVKNQDLWLRLLPLLSRHKVKFSWVRGHTGHPENERCDVLARQAANARGLEADAGYPG
ncbi:ribonuclease HI [Solidesulfovibrio carbinolicus]|uniref:Ribonuclease H n=1 Tax=Solidesulfovibrio carbinolicus TaxID=296842 RepID=A0A4P6HMN7_9BACT|nr:ribonuclease HI [Solidesulfovibrio carbinolicus]QAZ68497.1 ribonuclease HI [Solidesulfovibrio carbinolicus]